MSDDPARRLRENATEITSTVVTGIWLAALFTGQDWWLAALLVGYVVVVPLVAVLFGDENDVEEWWDEDERERLRLDDESEPDDPDARDALETLRTRYAAGELTDEQFERKLERLLETETLEDVEELNRAGGDDRGGKSDRNRDLEFES